MPSYTNPYQDMSFERIYSGLMDGSFGPHWPNEQIQKGYTGTNKVDLVRRAFQFIDIVEKDGAFISDWKGLDYGCGWGRLLSVLLSCGGAEQADGCDAWSKTLDIISTLGFKNHIFKVPELLDNDSIVQNTYNFIISFSVFTHLSPDAIVGNIPPLLRALKEGGKLYITVRHEEFILHKYRDRADALIKRLRDDGIVFVDSGGDMTGAKVFGDTIVTGEYMSRFAGAKYLGQPHANQHVYALPKN